MAEPRIVVGTIGAAHGVKGEVRIKAHTADPLSLDRYGSLAASDGRTLEIERLRPGKGVVIAKLRGIDDRNAAETLNGLDLSVERTMLPPPEQDEFYHADLIGLSAASPAGEPIGTVIAVHNYGAGDILEIAPKRGATFLLPFTRETVPSVDLERGAITLVPPGEIEARQDASEELESKS